MPGVQQERKSQLPRAVFGQRLLDCDEVLEGFGHLAAGDGQMTRV